jgi:hypothetical protein
MRFTGLTSSSLRLFRRLIPRRLHTPALRARSKVDGLDAQQRRVLAQNLRRMLRPDAA